MTKEVFGINDQYELIIYPEQNNSVIGKLIKRAKHTIRISQMTIYKNGLASFLIDAKKKTLVQLGI